MNWELLVLFLLYLYFDVEEAGKKQVAALSHAPTKLQFEWMVHAAASNPAYPRETSNFSVGCSRTRYDENGYSPLLLAAKAIEMAEPTGWDEKEELYRAPVVVASTSPLRNEKQPVPATAALFSAMRTFFDSKY
jgi:hypothetical protein